MDSEETVFRRADWQGEGDKEKAVKDVDVAVLVERAAEEVEECESDGEIVEGELTRNLSGEWSV